MSRHTTSPVASDQIGQGSRASSTRARAFSTTLMTPTGADRFGSTLWRVAQVAAAIATVMLLIGLVYQPRIALLVLWSIVIPVVPASLLVAPQLWRNICPLATFNILSNDWLDQRVPRSGTAAVGRGVGIALL